LKKLVETTLLFNTDTQWQLVGLVIVGTAKIAFK